jgi:pyruvate-formate lyase-activating enzyme
MIIKNRNRSQYTFANINLLGACNARCFFCLGNDLKDEFSKYNQLNVHFTEWEKFNEFVDDCKSKDIKQIYITGQNTDSLQYLYLSELIDRLKSEGFYVGLRSNGLLAMEKMDAVNQCTTCFGDAVSYSIHTLKSDVQQKIIGVKEVPDWSEIIRSTKAKLRISIVVNRWNKSEVIDILHFLKQFNNVEYVQLRRVSTETKMKLYAPDQKAFDCLAADLISDLPTIAEYETARVLDFYGLKVSLWATVSTSANSINYFTNGVISDEYFIIEGYAKQKGIDLNNFSQ